MESPGSCDHAVGLEPDDGVIWGEGKTISVHSNGPGMETLLQRNRLGRERGTLSYRSALVMVRLVPSAL